MTRLALPRPIHILSVEDHPVFREGLSRILGSDESWLSKRSALDSRLTLSGTMGTHERIMIEEALRASGGCVCGPTGAAAQLGVPRSTLESKIRALQIDKRRFRTRPAKIA